MQIQKISKTVASALAYIEDAILAQAEGNEENLKEFIEWCKTGPGGGWIDETIVSDGAIRNFNTFEIRFI